MSNKRLFFYLTLVVLAGSLVFFRLYLYRYRAIIEQGSSTRPEMITRILPFCGLAQLVVFLLSWLYFHLLHLALGKNLGDRKINVIRYGTLAFALAVETAFLIEIKDMEAGSLVDIASSVPLVAFAVFLSTFFAAKIEGTAKR